MRGMKANVPFGGKYIDNAKEKTEAKRQIAETEAKRQKAEYAEKYESAYKFFKSGFDSIISALVSESEIESDSKEEESENETLNSDGKIISQQFGQKMGKTVRFNEIVDCFEFTKLNDRSYIRRQQCEIRLLNKREVAQTKLSELLDEFTQTVSAMKIEDVEANCKKVNGFVEKMEKELSAYKSTWFDEFANGEFAKGKCFITKCKKLMNLPYECVKCQKQYPAPKQLLLYDDLSPYCAHCEKDKKLYEKNKSKISHANLMPCDDITEEKYWTPTREKSVAEAKLKLGKIREEYQREKREKGIISNT